MRRPQRRSFEQYAALASAGYALYKQAEDYYGRYRAWTNKRTQSEHWIVRIYESEQERLFHAVGSWALSHLPDGPSHDITVGIRDDELVQTPPDEPDLDMLIPFNGDLIPAAIRTQKNESGAQSIIVSRGRFSGGRYLLIMCRSEQQRQNLLDFINETFVEADERELLPEIYRATKTGSSRYVRKLVPREPDTVFLPDGMLNDILGDVSRFLTSQQDYTDMGVPYHRGYLLHGPAGTGKTTTICTVASFLGKHVYLIPLTELSDDSALISAMSAIPYGANDTIVVLEDVDVFRNTHTRSAKGQSSSGEDKGVTLEGLLNVLDGLLTPDGLVTFMTTNHPERLDDALIRPGRIDRKFELGHMTQGQLDAMVQRFVGNYKVELRSSTVVPAQIVECLKSGFDNPVEVVLDKIRREVSG